MSMTHVRIGSGAGFSGDRIEPAVELAEKGDIRYLVFECLAERTIAIAQQARLKDPAQGYDPLLVDRMKAVLKPCREKGIKIITNMGAANPLSAAEKVKAVARQSGLRKLRIAAVIGDDVTELVKNGEYVTDDASVPMESIVGRLVSANAYLGAQPIVEALAGDADVIVTGRTSDPALYLAPQVHEFGWSMEDWERLGQGTVIGHLLECAGQITGGYFADPGCKDVPDLARLGFPFADVFADGTAIIGKVAGSGGVINAATCAEQLLYEIHDPREYLTPDVIADFSRVTLTEAGDDQVLVKGGSGRERPDRFKVSVGYRDGYTGEGQISYAGLGAAARARLALEIVLARLDLTGVKLKEIRTDLIGINSIHGKTLSASDSEPYEVRARVIARADAITDAVRVGNEVEALYTNGPAGGGGVMKAVREKIAVSSILLPRDRVEYSVYYVES